MEGAKINADIMIDMDFIVRFDRINQQLRTAIGIGGIQPCIAMPRNTDVSRAQQGDHFNLLAPFIDRNQDHGIRARIVLGIARVTSD